MDNKTKDAIKQLQADMRQLHTLLAGKQSDGGNSEEPPAAPKAKGEVAVQYAVGKSGTHAVTEAQIAKVTDEAAAALGYALSSPQKVALLRALLLKETESAAALGAAAHLSTGSLYHHLRDLMHADLIKQAGRNQYMLTPRGGRILLVVLALATES